jgi:putative membrane protein
MIELIIVLGILIALISWYAQHRRLRRARIFAKLRDPDGLEMLARRYARGDIGRDEYLQKRRDIEGNPQPAVNARKAA